MSPAAGNLDHLLVRDRVEPKDWTARGGGGKSAIRRVNRAAHGRRLLRDIEGVFASAKQARSVGSLHQDEWIGAGADLAACSHVVVYPTGGWWKNNRRRDRLDVPVRYSLILSLTSGEQDVDLYTPIAMELGVPISETVEVTA